MSGIGTKRQLSRAQEYDIRECFGRDGQEAADEYLGQLTDFGQGQGAVESVEIRSGGGTREIRVDFASGQFLVKKVSYS